MTTVIAINDKWYTIQLMFANNDNNKETERD